ncbi:uncharacterized protein DNG_02793 [Cephalotrichum gorgonifer]|uniref:Protein-arginine deiminase C-terminal domain-containing protein n=1 Tax=Cephalotrichum gorgonifer TaxID=2041049 RepID=A0AAE8MTT6_9PEZI|nr:uncharacterized protein DNG_02793 [Cephalotrichum gorgonifer]
MDTRSWRLPLMHPYMKTRYFLVDALLEHFGHRNGHVAAVEMATDHLMDVLRKLRSDHTGVWQHVPADLVRLGREQDTYDFMKWYATMPLEPDYDPDDWSAPFLNIEKMSRLITTVKGQVRDLVLTIDKRDVWYWQVFDEDTNVVVVRAGERPKSGWEAFAMNPVYLASWRVSPGAHRTIYSWSQDQGAIFLPNIGDTSRRCPTVDLAGTPLDNQELASCHDASGDHLLTSELAAPLKTVPLTGLPDDASGRIYTEPDSARDRVNIFWRRDLDSTSDPWSIVDPQMSFNKTALSNGIELRIVGRGLVTDATVWNGTVNVVLETTAGNRSSVDHVAMKQAPVLVHHHLQEPEVVLTTRGDKDLSPWQARFVEALEENVAEMRDDIPVLPFNDTMDIWAQDFLEPAYASMPGPDGPISLRVLLRSAQSTRHAGRQVFEQLRGPNVGGFQPGRGSGFGWEEINSGGNIETIPPYVSRSGVKYPAGRVITGKHFELYPAASMMTFIKSQGLQTPLILEAGWLAIGHVDEIVQFLPFDNELGFTIAVVDTTSALKILREAADKGHGDSPVITYDGDATPDGATFFLDERLLNETIDGLLANDTFIDVNSYAQRHIDQNLALLLEDIPISDSDVLRMPTLFHDVTYPWLRTPDGHPSRLNLAPPRERQVISLFPESLNGLVLGSEYLAPKPWGPIVDGRDIIEEAVVDVYEKAGMKVRFLDDFMSHHVRGGEVHCGTNTLRQTDVAWWE